MCQHALVGHMSTAAATTPQYEQINNNPVPKKIDSIYENRLRQFIDQGQYADLNLPKFYDTYRLDHNKDDTDLDKGYIEYQVHEVPNAQDRPLFKDIKSQFQFRPAKKGDVFGPSWKTFWFEVKIRTPLAWSKEEQVWLQWDCGNEGLLYTADGVPLQAFTGGERDDFILPKEWCDGQEHLFYIETACNGMFGVGNGSDIAPPDPNRYFRLNKADLIVPNLEARALRIDYWIITDAAREFSSDSYQKYRARQVATEIIEAFDYNDVASVAKCREIARKFIGENVDNSEVFDTELKTEVVAVGHCHIDTAWLWPFGETRRKVVRSWTTQLDLIDRYPEYRFVASQAQQYKWLSQDHPEIYTKLQAAVKKGNFIPIGGSWVEHDTNIPTGESLVRQFVFGQRFFEANFGFRSDTFWLPDTFGYSSQIPQISQLAGLTNFLTQKLSWNNINNFPNTSFNWVALDGTQVLTHMPPANTYTADANFGDVHRSISQHKNLTYDQTGLLVFGKGDGGGGPNPDMLDKLRRCRGVSNTVGQLPTVKMGDSITNFFDKLKENTDGGKNLVTWIGELYFEFHRGTYTTQALVKKLMRRSEIRLHDLEYFATIASICKKDSYSYPTKEIKALWENVLLCQFHDVLPGSCIGMVYEMDVHPMLKAVVKKADDLLSKALGALSDGSKKLVDQDFQILSTLQWPRTGIVKIPRNLTDYHADFIQESGKVDYVYTETSPKDGQIKLHASGLKHPASVTENSDGTFTLSNDRFNVVIDGGLITSLYDLVEDREVLDLKTGANKTGANQLVLLDDTPLNWQAWDTEVFSLDKIHNVAKGSVKINESGPLKASVLVTQKISKDSYIKTIISLNGTNDIHSNNSIVEFDCKVNWNESRKFLKVEFPVDVHSEYASYETQFGITKRPTHYNTSWDVAKFEVCQHKFADYSEFNYGVSIFNDSKYGFSTHGNLMRLSLLRSPKEPDPNADIGKHHFKYAIYPHQGPLSAKSIELSHYFNHDVFTPFVVKNDVNEHLQLIKIHGDDNLILSHVKRGENDVDVSLGELPTKDEVSLVARVYEGLGGKARGSLTTKGPLTKVFKVNILEDELEELKFIKVSKNGVELFEIPIQLRAFEIASYKLVF
ncbi:hypothetical protein WICPIJ_010088 [Wickerhamomyces pijperi]|uniref:Alpha-mannosidase n=1 Tax=Wickerhamomyces pijperi TaxID=599730 RepID=A0A9P8PHS7_WICPI|nr:hypothetical protein WICPIJ_010088 [Wickerhamomyces pijperi]